jgi:hypothetical protein
MIRIDCQANKYVANTLETRVPLIFRAVADCTETYGIDDIWYSAGTEANYAGFPCENKTSKGGWKFKYDDDWNEYFTCGIYNKLDFKGEPPAVGTPIYFINATDAYGNYERGKFSKLLDNKASLTFFAPDCIIFYTWKMLEDAFMGYADYYVKHTTEFGGYNKRRWETKAILNLNKGLYIPCDPPIELFEK